MGEPFAKEQFKPLTLTIAHPLNKTCLISSYTALTHTQIMPFLVDQEQSKQQGLKYIGDNQ